MASRYFIPTSGEYSWTGSVWAATPTGAAGSAATPVTNDDVYIVQGQANITSGLNQSAVNLASLHIGFSGTIGTPAASLQIGLYDSCHAYVYGSGSHNLTVVESVTNTSTITVYDTYVGTLNLSNSVFYIMRCGTTGSVAFSACTITDVITCGCSLKSDSGSVISNINIYDGNHDMASDISGGNIYIAGKSATLNYSGTTPAFVDVVSGKYIHDSSRTITQIDVKPTGRAEVGPNAGPFTVTNSNLYAGGSLFERHGNNITYTVGTVKVAIR